MKPIPLLSLNLSENALAYRVIHQICCPDCKGAGVVTHPIWVEFFEPYPLPELPEDYDARALELGYNACADMPPEEMTCPKCEGLGYVRREVPLAVALMELGLL